MAKSPTLYDSSVHMPNMVRSSNKTTIHCSGKGWLITLVLSHDDKSCGFFVKFFFGWMEGMWLMSKGDYISMIKVQDSILRQSLWCCESRWGRGEGLGFEFFITTATSEQGLPLSISRCSPGSAVDSMYLGVRNKWNKCVACSGFAYEILSICIDHTR